MGWYCQLRAIFKLFAGGLYHLKASAKEAVRCAVTVAEGAASYSKPANL